MLQIPGVLDSEQVRACRQALTGAHWEDGRITAGFQSALAKNNMQIPEEDPLARRLGDMIVSALERTPLFLSAALPLRVFPPLFNCYGGGQAFGTHVDNAIRQVRGTPHRIRTDLSATLFLTPPDEYDGGVLTIEHHRRGAARHAEAGWHGGGRQRHRAFRLHDWPRQED
jgi:PKHD-type hydroxylase